MGTAGWEIVGATLVAVLSAAPFPVAPIEPGHVVSQAGNSTASGIRTDNPDIKRAIAQATEWSDTFRGLVEAIERTDGIVWILQGPCNGTFACLSMYLKVAGPHRHLRIHVDVRRLGNRLMESLGHELQHAVEVLGTSVRSGAGIYHFYAHRAGGYRVGGSFETRAAVQAGIAVGGEVARARRARPTDRQAKQP